MSLSSAPCYIAKLKPGCWLSHIFRPISLCPLAHPNNLPVLQYKLQFFHCNLHYEQPVSAPLSECSSHQAYANLHITRTQHRLNPGTTTYCLLNLDKYTSFFSPIKWRWYSISYRDIIGEINQTTFWKHKTQCLTKCSLNSKTKESVFRTVPPSSILKGN